MKKIYILLLILVVCAPLLINAQGEVTQKKKNYLWDVSANAGLSLLWGDANSNGNPLQRWFSDEVSLAYGVTVKRKITDAFQLQFAFQNGILKGKRAKWSGDVYHPVITAKTNFYDYHIGLNVDFTALFGAKPDRLISVYMFGGIGMVHYSGNSYGDDTLMHTVDSKSLMIPWGGGLRLRLDERWSLYGETNFRHAFLDDVDAYIGSGSETNDIYSITGLGVTYKFGPKKPKKIKEPKVELTPYEPIDSVVAEVEEPTEIKYSSNIPKIIEPNSEYMVNTSFSMGDIKGKVIYEFNIPEDIYIGEIVSENANVEKDSSSVKVIWDNIAASDILVNYKLTTGGLEKNSYIVRGSLSYEENDENKTKTFSDRMSLKGETTASNTNNQDKGISKNDNVSINGGVSASNNSGVAEVVPSEVIATNGLEYRVQVAAVFGGTTSKRMLQRKLRIDDEIKEDPYKNSYRYTVGSFETYGEAAQYKALEQVKGAYVVVFKDGKYIGQLDKTNAEVMDKDGVFESGETFKVQLSASKGRPYSISKLAYKYGLDENKIMEDKTSSGWYQYSIGKYLSKEDAQKYLNEIKLKISSAYIIRFIDGKRVKM